MQRTANQSIRPKFGEQNFQAAIGHRIVPPSVYAQLPQSTPKTEKNHLKRVVFGGFYRFF
ncbi:MAG: hypothetical protein CVT92_12635 [Bacteroidetes bacterium HGW-Bacteroidetes-1]|nr:MAG: hypothetical protein CVT92_12635 [Bacteroidetes bacterium HGW-Bacteroidetes-1]